MKVARLPYLTLQAIVVPLSDLYDISFSMMPLTPSSLTTALLNIASANSPEDKQALLVAGATLLQRAVLVDDLNAFDAALDSIPGHLQVPLNAVMQRSVEVHAQADGSQLALWLIPVVVALKNANLPSILPLESSSMSQVKLSGLLLKQFGLADVFSKSDVAEMGWNHIVPFLYSMEQVTAADLFSLISLPLQAQARIRGDASDIYFDCGPLEPARADESLYFLPVVVKHGAGAPIEQPAPDAVMAARLATWVDQTITEANNGIKALVRVSEQPYLYTEALDAGEKFELDVKVVSLVESVSEQVKVHAHGMSALVAPYHELRTDEFVLGITLTSRLTNVALATLAIPIVSEGMDESLQASKTLQKMGLHVHVHMSPIASKSCQHCGEMQLSQLEGNTAARVFPVTPATLQ
jgi:hypothetical protein